MKDRFQLRRRDVLHGGLALGASQLLPRFAWAQDGPWAARPQSAVDQVGMAVWSYGDVYTNIASQFEQDWGVPVEPSIIPFNELPRKLASLFAAGEYVDASQTSPATIGAYNDQGFIEPLNDLPGAQEYIDDFTDVIKASCVFDGQLLAMPFMTAVWGWNYNAELVDKLGGTLPTSLEEMDEMAAKAVADNVSQHPYVWCAVSQAEHVTFTWYALTWSRGSAMFGADKKPLLGEGSEAREALRWWAKTFADGLSDPSSLNLSMNASAQAFSTGGHVFRGPTQHYGIAIINDPEQSPIAGQGRMWSGPQGYRTITSSHLVFMPTAYSDKEWAWKLVQYLGGKTQDGEYTMAKRLANVAMFGPGYKSLVDSPVVTEDWKRWADPDVYTQLLQNATNTFDVVPVFFEPWYQEWNTQAIAQVQSALTGSITADEACDTLIQAAANLSGL